MRGGSYLFENPVSVMIPDVSATDGQAKIKPCRCYRLCLVIKEKSGLQMNGSSQRFHCLGEQLKR